MLLFIAGVALTIFSAFIFYKFGWISVILFAVTALIPVLTKGFEEGLTLFTFPLAAGTVGGYIFRKPSGLDLFLPVSSILFAVVITADYHILKIVKGYDFVETGKVAIVQAVEDSKQGLDAFKGYNASDESRKKMREDIDTTLTLLNDRKWIQLAKDMIPFSSFLYAVLVSGFSFLLMKKVFMKREGEPVRSLELFRLNEYFIFTLIFGWGVFLLLSSVKYPIVTVVALNVALVSSTLYIIQALGIVKYFTIKKGFPGVIMPLGIMTLIFLGPSVMMFIMIILTGIGALDVWGDFRKLNSETERNIKE